MFHSFIYQPILSLTLGVYTVLGAQDLGVAILGVTILIRLILLPLSLKAQRSQKQMAEIAPHIESIKQKYSGDSEAQSRELMKVYQERGINPLAGCLPLLVQFPILIGLYQVFLGIVKPGAAEAAYAFVRPAHEISHIAFGFLDIAQPSIVLAIGAGMAQFFQLKFTSTTTQGKQSQVMTQQLTYTLPFIIIAVSWNLPSGLALYWITTSLFSLAEQLYLRRS
jgi:YidC/Oxa1 family membrane protein insertase